jgi:DNA-binding GntR family transcriptional regulator
LTTRWNLISHANIDEQVYKVLAEQIISGALAPGTKITEQEIASRLGVSRTPIREAIKALARDDLIEMLPRRAMYVRKLSPEDVAEIYEVRSVLEALAAKLATARFPQPEIARLRAQAESCVQDLDKGHMDTFLQLDAKLHSLILEYSGNKRLQKLLGSLNDLIHYLRAQGARQPARARQALTEHGRILDALESRDPERAEAAMREHVRITISRTLEDIGFGPGQPREETR